MRRWRLLSARTLVAAGFLVPATAAAQGLPAAAPPPPPAAVAPVESTAPLDLRGAVGFGFSVIPSTTLVGTSSGVGIKAWLSDKLALSSLVNLRYSKVSGTTAWSARLEAVWLGVIFKSQSTRLEAGGGFAFTLSQTPTNLTGDMGQDTDTRYDVSVPLQAGVEHFFARWFSAGIAARVPLIEVASVGEGQSISFALDSTQLLAQIFFYSD